MQLSDELADRVPPGQESHLTDLGNAHRLVRRHGGELRYCRPWRAWFVWDGRRWARDVKGQVFQLAKATVRGLYEEAAQERDSARRKALATHATRSESEPRIRSMVVLAETEPEIAVRPDELDSDPWALNVLNGTIDLATGTLRPHDPGNLITRLAPVEYEAAEACPLWTAFLQRVLPDEPLRAFMQRAVGYSITGDTREEVLFFPHGPTAAGKSTFIEAVKATLGEYAMTADFSTFLRSRRDGGSPRSDIARLSGARFVASVEVDEGKRLAEGLVKLITGGDTVTARALYREEFEFVPHFKLWLAANSRPRVRDDDDALWRRILQVPFTEQIPEEDRDPDVKAALRDPQESGPGILAWAVAGCLRWQEEGLAPPPAVRQATREYREEMDPLRDFIAERCHLAQEASASSEDLWHAYLEWVKATRSSEALGRRAFSNRLGDHGFRSERLPNGRNKWGGIGLVQGELK